MTPEEFLQYLLSLPEEARLQTIDSMRGAMDSGEVDDETYDLMSTLLSGVNAVSAFPEAQGEQRTDADFFDYIMQIANNFGAGPNAVMGRKPGDEGFDPHLSMAEALASRGMHWIPAGLLGTAYDFIEPGPGEFVRAGAGIAAAAPAVAEAARSLPEFLGNAGAALAVLPGVPKGVQQRLARSISSDTKDNPLLDPVWDEGNPTLIFHGDRREVGTNANPIRDAYIPPQGHGGAHSPWHREGHGHTGLFGSNDLELAEKYGYVLTYLAGGVPAHRVASVGERSDVTADQVRELIDYFNEANSRLPSGSRYDSLDDLLLRSGWRDSTSWDNLSIADVTYHIDNLMRGGSSWRYPLPPGATSLTERRMNLGIDAFSNLASDHPEVAFYRAGSAANIEQPYKVLRMIHELGGFDDLRGLDSDSMGDAVLEMMMDQYSKDEVADILKDAFLTRTGRADDFDADILAMYSRHIYNDVFRAWDDLDLERVAEFIRLLNGEGIK